MKRLANLVITLGGLALMVASVSFVWLFFTSTTLVTSHAMEPWLYLTNLHDNGHISWRRDHISQLMAYLFPTAVRDERPLVLLIPLLSGLFLYVRTILRLEALASLSFAIIPIIFVLYVSGINPLIIGTIAWVPLCALCMYNVLHSSPNWKRSIPFTLVSIELAYSANGCAPLASALTLIVLVITEKLLERKHRSNSIWLWSILILLVPTIWITCEIPEPPIFDYLKTMHVLNGDPSGDASFLPLIGPAPLFPTIAHSNLDIFTTTTASVLLAMCGLLLLVNKAKANSTVSSTLLIMITILGIIILEPLAADPLADIAPLRSLTRMIPWATFYALPNVLLAAIAFLTGLLVCLLISAPRAIMLSMAFCLLTTIVNPQHLHPLLTQTVKASTPHLLNALRSPSATILRQYSTNLVQLSSHLARTEEVMRSRPRNAKSLGATIAIAPAPSEEKLTLSRKTDPQERISPLSGSQTGEELLTVSFPREINIRGIELNTGRYFSDYPRGIRVSGGNCSSSDPTTIVSIDEWHGALRQTPSGLPYYDVPHNVVIIFPRDHRVQCLYVRQTGKAAVDWSIAKINIY